MGVGGGRKSCGGAPVEHGSRESEKVKFFEKDARIPKKAKVHFSLRLIPLRLIEIVRLRKELVLFL